jgi:hypothetical protein
MGDSGKVLGISFMTFALVSLVIILGAAGLFMYYHPAITDKIIESQLIFPASNKSTTNVPQSINIVNTNINNVNVPSAGQYISPNVTPVPDRKDSGKSNVNRQDQNSSTHNQSCRNNSTIIESINDSGNDLDNDSIAI